MADLKALENRLAEKVRLKDELAVRRLAELYYKQEAAMILPAKLQFAAATCFAKAADYARAATYYKRFLRFHRDHARVEEARYRLGILYARYLENPEEARRHLTLVAENSDAKRAAEAKHALAKLSRASREVASRSATVRSGRCAVLKADEGAIDVSAVGREIASILGKRLVDVTREIKASHCVLALDVERAAAQRIAAALAGLSIPVKVVDQADFPPVPVAEIVTRADFSEGGYTLTVRESVMAGKYDEFGFIVAAQMRLGETEPFSRHTPGSAEGDFAGIRILSPGGAGNAARKARAADFRVIDLFLRDSPRRLRLDERFLEITQDRKRAVNKRLNLRCLGEALTAFSTGVPSNRALDFFTHRGASSGAWEDFTFDTERAFDLYCRWLLTVKG